MVTKRQMDSQKDRQRRTHIETDGRTYGRTENLPILQDFVPYRGHCPASAQLQPKNYIKRGKGTADHMMPLGDWFISLFSSLFSSLFFSSLYPTLFFLSILSLYSLSLS